MASKLTSVKRPATGFAIGGVSTLLAIPTKEGGKNTLVVTPGATPKDLATVALAAGITALPSLLEFAEGGSNACAYSDNVAVGNNTYPKPLVAFKFDDADDNSLAVIVEALLFEKHTFVVKTKTGKYKILGLQNGLKATKADEGGDGSADGFAGHDISCEGGETRKAIAITAESFEDLLELVPV